MTTLDPFTALRLQRGAEHLHQLGPRATVEFLQAIADQIGGMPAILGLLVEYEQRLSPQLLRLTGRDRFPRRAPLAVPR